MMSFGIVFINNKDIIDLQANFLCCDRQVFK